MRFGKRGDDPTARHRLSAEQMHKVEAEILRRHARDETVRQIANAMGRPRTSVHRVIQRHRREQQLAEFAELAALNDELAELAAELGDRPWSRLTPEEQDRWALAEILADLERDPNDALANYRLRHIPTDTLGHPWA